MDRERFDALTRTLSSRRTAMGGLVGVVSALLGLTAPDDAAAHVIPLARCRRIKNARRRQACVRRARAHNRTCHPEPVAITCAGRCGTRGNNCRQAVNCPDCPAGQTCLSNGNCRACQVLQANCTTAAQCCQDDGELECRPVGNLFQRQCCRPLGEACSTPNQFNECCGIAAGGGGSLVYCAPNNTCGGPGAQCFDSSTCFSGLCCGIGLSMVCCGTGQRCTGIQCENL